MSLKLDDKLVIGVSSGALFDLEEENRIFDVQVAHTDTALKLVPFARVPYKT